MQKPNKKCFFHAWGEWKMTSSFSGAGIHFLCQSKVCKKCGKVKERIKEVEF